MPPASSCTGRKDQLHNPTYSLNIQKPVHLRRHNASQLLDCFRQTTLGLAGFPSRVSLEVLICIDFTVFTWHFFAKGARVLYRYTFWWLCARKVVSCNAKNLQFEISVAYYYIWAADLITVMETNTDLILVALSEPAPDLVRPTSLATLVQTWIRPASVKPAILSVRPPTSETKMAPNLPDLASNICRDYPRSY